LSIVKVIVEAHGGRAWVECGAGSGASFWFALPAIESPAATALQAAAERREEDRA
jgi:signal transduction histidine kinase